MRVRRGHNTGRISDRLRETQPEVLEPYGVTALKMTVHGTMTTRLGKDNGTWSLRTRRRE